MAILKSRLLGVAFIGLLVLGVWTVNAVFQQKFTSFDEVKVLTSTTGLQLPSRADVKVRGAIVGQVLKAEVSDDGDGAVLTLGLDPDQISQIPKNVTASLLPKTLFGEKYVNLVVPSQAAPVALRTGDTISQTAMPIEVERVLNDIYPLLRTVQPAELNYTLNALANALEGRGEKLGESIGVLDSYLKRINPKVPALVDDLVRLGSVSDTYADAVPELAETLRNTVKTGKTFVSQEQKLNAFLTNVSAFSETAEKFLDANGQNIIRLGQLAEPQLKLLARYAPEYPCLLGGIVNAAKGQADTFRGFVFHINLTLLPKQPRGYGPQDRQVYGAKNGPHCGELPNPSWTHDKIYNGTPNINDGVEANLQRGGNQRSATGFSNPASSSASNTGSKPASNTGLTTGITATAPEKALITALTAPVLGVPADRVPDLSTLLFGPLARGSEVSVR